MLRVVIQTVRLGAYGLILTGLAFAAHGEGMRLLEQPERWIIPDGGYDSFVYEEPGQVYFQRGGGLPGTLLSRDDFENFELQFQVSMSRGNQGGLYIGKPRNGAYRAAIQLRLSNQESGPLTPYCGGALYREEAPQTFAMKEAYEWNEVFVRMDWPRLEVEINGESIHDVDLSEHESLQYKPRRGAIGFLSNSGHYRVRNLELTPLPDTEPAVTLFDGHSLDGWEVIHGDAIWTIHEGALRGENGNGYIMHEKEVEDFDLRLYYRTSPAANGGVFFRWVNAPTLQQTSRGHEIQIWDMPEGYWMSGSIYNIERGCDLAIWPGEWNFMQISVRGGGAVVHINGVRVAETSALEAIRPGMIALQMHSANAWVDHKDIVLVPHD